MLRRLITITALLVLGVGLVAADELSPRHERGFAKMRGHLNVQAYPAQCETSADRAVALAVARGQAADVSAPRGCVLLAERNLPNLLVDSGEAYLVQAFMGAVNLSSLSFHAFGTDGTAAAETQIALIAENAGGRFAGVPSVGAAPNIWRQQVTAIFATGFTLREWGLFTQAAVGTMWSRIVVPAIAVPSGGTVIATYDLTVE